MADRIWPATNGPNTSANDGNSVNLANEFSVSVAATATHAHFYRGATDIVGTATANLWSVTSSSAGVLLASKVFTLSGTGWQTVAFNTPVPLTAGQRYRIGVHLPGGIYTVTSAYWTTGPGGSGITSGLITAPNKAGATGTQQSAYGYASSGVFPTQTFGGNNYWVDVTVEASGSSVPAGTGTSGWAYAGTGSGKRTPRASGGGAFAFASAGSGKRTPRGTGTASFAFTGTGTGKRTPKATGSGTLAYAGSGVGDAPDVGGASGSGSGTVQYSGNGDGRRIAKATGAGSLSFSGAGTGKRAPKATGTGAVTLMGTGLGVRRPLAAGTGAYSWAGAGSGTGSRPAVYNLAVREVPADYAVSHVAAGRTATPVPPRYTVRSHP